MVYLIVKHSAQAYVVERQIHAQRNGEHEDGKEERGRKDRSIVTRLSAHFMNRTLEQLRLIDSGGSISFGSCRVAFFINSVALFPYLDRLIQDKYSL